MIQPITPMQIRAIPTGYNGTRFRSRLEARWAAFFDLVGWKWDYEPVDLRGWTPDFVINGKAAIYVEVKPIQWGTDRYSYPTMELAQFEKVRSPGLNCDLLLLGAGPYERNDDLYVGYCNEPCPENDCCAFELAVSQDAEGGGVEFGYCDLLRSYHDRITGNYPGGSYGGHGRRGIELWRRAGNAVQWEGTKA